MTTKRPIHDARQPEIFFIEAEATRLIPAIGSTAWTVYTLLVLHTTRIYEANDGGDLLNSIADQCGLTEPEMRCAIELLARHGLIETIESPQPGTATGSQAIRIISAGLNENGDETWARERDERMAGRRLFEALIDVCDSDEGELDNETRRQLIAAVETIRSSGGNASQVYDAALVYREAIQGLPLTPRSLAMCWPMLVEMLPADEVVRSS